MQTALIWIGTFVITVLETLISTWEGRADRQSTSCRTNKYSIISSIWAVSFEIVLLVDILVVVAEGWTVIFPIIAGAGIGKYWSLERRRRKFRSRVRKPRKRRRDHAADGEVNET